MRAGMVMAQHSDEFIINLKVEKSTIFEQFCAVFVHFELTSGQKNDNILWNV